ncbi:anti-CBASS protein Acb1 family protein [Nitratireductor sp. GCM10026969]|uniref:anti-CBASS protein Acb1 family protein n=1 Tax=Nitratireductor sp. GCM10026969 TaxID=3252645 RepID=UPI003612905F
MNEVAKPRVRVTTDGVVTFADGFANFLSGLGAGNPKQAANGYALLRECSQFELEAAYEASTWFGKIVDIPADDATRGWRGWQAEDDQIEAIEREEKRLNVKQKLHQALIWSRLYGGAVIIPGGLPGKIDLPLRSQDIRKGSIKFLTVLHRHEINPHGIIRDPLSPFYGQPEHWTINDTYGRDVRLHPSRVILINGRKASTWQGGQQIWGNSVWTHLRDAVTNADAGAAVIGALMQEAKIDVIRMPQMMANMATAEYEAILLKRFHMAAMLKSVSNVLLLDKDDEWDQKSVTWSGLPDVMSTLLTILSGASDIPVTRLIGTSAKGLNATGEGDLRNYYDNVKAKQELTLSPVIEPLDEMLIRSGLGDRPDEVWYDWNPLWQPTEKEQAEIDKLEAETTNIYAISGLIPSDALSTATQNRMIESGRWPGIEQALQEAEEELEEPTLDPDEGDLETGQPGQQQAADAAPRTLYVRRNVRNAAEIIRWAKSQGFNTTLPADDLHVTIAFSRQPVDWMEVGQSWSDEVRIATGGPRMMEKFGEANVLLFASSELSWRHEEMKRAGASWDHPEYQPHITISYAEDAPDLADVEPYQGEIVLGPEIFEEVNEDWQAGVIEE